MDPFEKWKREWKIIIKYCVSRKMKE